MLRVNINGQSETFRGGTTILRAARELGFEVPTLCHDERLRPVGACRLCSVEIRGWNRLAAACTTLLADGMEIQTDSPSVTKARETILSLLAQNYPACVVKTSPEAPFHRLLSNYDLEANPLIPPQPDSSHPYIKVDMSRCIGCFRCVRMCDEVEGRFVWQVWNRGDRSEIRTSSGKSLLESNCVSCGACVDTCPTGALEDKSVLFAGKPETWTRTVCPYCGTGCEMMVGVRENRIVQIRPALNSPVNLGHLCVKGRYAFGFNMAPDRITHPMIRRDGAWKECSWDEAIQFASEKLRECIAKHGPDSVGVLGSARGTNEENYLAQKFARIVIGTNNVDCCARVCHAPTAAAMSAMLGTGAATNSFSDIERAGAFLICGCNPTENHPVVGERIKQAVLAGAKLIVIDPRRIELADLADVHLALRPGTNVPLLNSMAAVIIEEKLVDQRWITERVGSLASYEDFIRHFAPEAVASECGVHATQIREAARLYATTRPAMCFHGLGVTEHTQGVDGVKCLVNLALLTGNLGKPGSGVNPLRGQNNVQGAAHMGCEPKHLAGYADIDQARERFSETWNAPIPRNPGFNLMQMIDAAADGKLKALWAIGYDVGFTNPDATRTAAALSKLDFLLVQDLFLNETARAHAHLFLPAASSFERDGTFMNSERRVQRIRSAVIPLGQARADWQIICQLARAMGHAESFDYLSAQQIWDEIRSLWPAGAGITYDRLDHGGKQWPCPDLMHPGTAILHNASFPLGPRARLEAIPYLQSLQKTTDEYPFLLTTGRTLFQFNSGTMTTRTQNSIFRSGDTLDIAPSDADRLQISDGDQLLVKSRFGEASLPAKIDARLNTGEVFATFHSEDAFVNRVIGNGRDQTVLTPEYKVVPVRIERI